MKGTVYRGVIQLKEYPQADMHGNLIAVVRTSGVLSLTSALHLYGIGFHPMFFSLGLWHVSKCAVENLVTERYYGQVLVCPLWCQNLTAENYKPIPAQFKTKGAAK